MPFPSGSGFAPEYSIEASSFSFRAVLGTGFHLDVAARLVAALTQACDIARPMETSWTKPYFQVALRKPKTSVSAQAGDLCVWQERTSSRPLSHGADVYSEHFLAGHAVAVESGRVVVAATPGGEPVLNPARVAVFSAKQFNACAVRADLAARFLRHKNEGLLGPLWGHFQSPLAAAAVLGRHLLPGVMRPVSARRVAEIVATVGVIPASRYSPSPVQVATLQEALDRIVQIGRAHV